jgi:lipopolysaccharide transport system ATP-binding protein
VAINVSPDILVVDEALAVGDEGFQRKCFARIEAIRDAGATVLFVSHSAGTVVELCDRAILLDQGELLTQGTPRHVVSQYQKLLYAPADRASRIREEIRASSAGAASTTEHLSALKDAGALPVDLKNSEPEKDEIQPYWDEGLVSSSTISYENRGAVIETPHLQALDGRKINVLVPGGTYVYTYTVRLERTLAYVRCGMMIRSITGIEVGGGATSMPQNGLPVVSAGAVLNVRFRFRCLLAPGTYFFNAGVLATLSEGEEYVDRRIDAVMFRVMPDINRLTTGFVDLDVVPHLSIAS